MRYHRLSSCLYPILLVCTLLNWYVAGLSTAQATDKPLVDPCAILTVEDMTKLIEQKVSEPIRSALYEEGDHACEYGLADGSGPIEIRSFPGDPWDRIHRLHPDASPVSEVGAKALQYRDEALEYEGIYVKRKNVVVEIGMPFSPDTAKILLTLAKAILKKL